MSLFTLYNPCDVFAQSSFFNIQKIHTLWNLSWSLIIILIIFCEMLCILLRFGICKTFTNFKIFVGFRVIMIVVTLFYKMWWISFGFHIDISLWNTRRLLCFINLFFCLTFTFLSGSGGFQNLVDMILVLFYKSFVIFWYVHDSINSDILKVIMKFENFIIIVIIILTVFFEMSCIWFYFAICKVLNNFKIFLVFRVTMIVITLFYKMWWISFGFYIEISLWNTNRL